MNLEQVSAEIRPRTYPESIDLGFRMALAWQRPIFGAWIAVFTPFFAILLFALYRWPAVAVLLIWWTKPLFERIPLYVVSRALFGDLPSVRETLRFWFSHLGRDTPAALFWLRFDPFRSLRLPVRQLEGQSGTARRRRFKVLAAGVRSESVLLTVTCIAFELCLFSGLALFSAWLFPSAAVTAWLENDLPLPLELRWVLVLFFAAASGVVQPFYVSAGFGLYVNRRTHLEAWDVEVVFRRMAKRLVSERTRRAATAALLMLGCLVLLGSTAVAEEGPPPTVEPAQTAEPDPRAVIDGVLASPVFGGKRTEIVWSLRERDSTAPTEGSGWPESLSVAIGRLIRATLWIAVILGIAWAVFLLVRRSGSASRRASEGDTGGDLPIEVLGMDVRRESLPEDIARSALRLWQDGKGKQALRLLYRGALSRLISIDRLPLKPSTTEGECLRMATLRIGPSRFSYLNALTIAWQETAYGHRPANRAHERELIEQWETHFGTAG